MAESPRVTLGAWPKLMDLRTVAAYSCIAESTWRDYILEEIIKPIRPPGSRLRKAGGAVETFAKDHRLRKILVDRADVDALIEKWKAGAA